MINLEAVLDIIIAEMACAVLVGGALGLLGATILEWRRERDELVRENESLRERLRNGDRRVGWELLSGD